MDYQKFGQVKEKATALHAKAPNWKAIQELLIQDATLRRYYDPEGTAQVYRQAILAAGSAKDGHVDIELLFSGFRHAIILAMEIGHYQDALDFALIGLTYVKPEGKDDPLEAIMEFLIETSRAMTKLGRFDLAEDALFSAIGLLPDVPADWNQRIQIAASEFYSLIGDTEFSLYKLNLVKQFSRAEHSVQSAPVLMRQRAEVLKQLGNYLAAEGALRACISMATLPVILPPDPEMGCRWDLSRLLWEDLGDYNEGGEEYIKALKLSVAHQDIFAMVEMSNFFILRGLLQGYQDPIEAIERSQQAIETLHRFPTTVRVDAYRAMSHLIALFGQKKLGEETLAWAPFDESLYAVMAEPNFSTKEYRSLMMIGRSHESDGRECARFESPQ